MKQVGINVIYSFSTLAHLKELPSNSFEVLGIADFLGGIQLITEAAHRVPDRENTGFRQRLRQVPDDLRERLRTTTPAVKDYERLT